MGEMKMGEEKLTLVCGTIVKIKALGEDVYKVYDSLSAYVHSISPYSHTELLVWEENSGIMAIISPEGMQPAIVTLLSSNRFVKSFTRCVVYLKPVVEVK